MLKMLYKKVRPSEDLFIPKKRPEDADYDLFASVDTVVKPGEVVGVSTNLSVRFAEGWEGKIEGKSGIASKTIFPLGGVIDNSYIGEIIVMILNLSSSQHFFAKGHKVAQLKLREVTPEFQWVEVDDLGATIRSDKGFGSTGV
jgi:dUTP pyrophosphatase